jgi:hypothetical protein
MEYHKDRFEDFWATIYENENLLRWCLQTELRDRVFPSRFNLWRTGIFPKVNGEIADIIESLCFEREVDAFFYFKPIPLFILCGNQK